jgi:hypothetical protein
MAAMSMFRLHKRIVVTIAGLAFLLCQGAALAQACLTMPQGAAGAATQQPCHGSGNESSVQGSCQYVSSAVPDVPVHPAAEAPALTAQVVPIAAVPGLAFDPLPFLYRPPPHSLLHCCLRN